MPRLKENCHRSDYDRIHEIFAKICEKGREGPAFSRKKSDTTIRKIVQGTLCEVISRKKTILTRETAEKEAAFSRKKIQFLRGQSVNIPDNCIL